MPAGVTESPEDPGGEVLVPVFGDGSLLLVVDIDEVVTLRVIAEFLESAAARFRWETVRMTLPSPMPANGTDCATRRTPPFPSGCNGIIGSSRSCQAHGSLTDKPDMYRTDTIDLGRRLGQVLAEQDRFAIRRCAESQYRQFRALEPGLVSCLDDRTGGHAAYLLVTVDHEPAGVLSFVQYVNPQKAPPADSFGRIDLVIVAERFRNLGLARLLTLSALVYALEVFGRRLYSISCLAAHPAMETILGDIGFTVRPRDGRNYVHTELPLAPGAWAGLLDDAAAETKSAAQVSNYRIRRRMGSV